MASRFGETFIAIFAKDETDKGFAAARAKANSFMRDLTQGIAQGVGQAIAQGVGNLLRAGVDEIGKSVKVASDLNETIAKTSAVFRDSSGDILAWSQTTSSAFGLTQQGALNAASSIGNMFKQLGAGTGDAAAFSKDLVALAGDLVAFHNVAGGTPDVLNDIQSAFRGEFDPIQKYIPVINAAAVQQQALADTGKETAAQLTALDKAMATQALIVRGMGDAYGAAAREIDSAASQQRIFTARMEEGAARIGQVFLPIQRVFFQGLNELLDMVAPYGEGILDSFAAGLARGIVALTPFFAQLRSAFVYWLQPGSPPRLLKELTEWGKSAMQEYLRGWTLADFDALRSLGGIIESIVRSFAGSGNIAETDLVSRIFGTQRTISTAIREFRELGQVSEATLGSIADAAGPAGTEVAGLVREYFELQKATQRVSDAQNNLNTITRRYSDALDPLNAQLGAVRGRQRELQENQELKGLGKTLKDPRALTSERELARLRIEEIALERQARAIEGERDVAVDAAQDKIDVAKAEETAQQAKFSIAQQALEQQTKINGLITEETDLRKRLIEEGLQEERRVLALLEEEKRKADAEERKRLAELERIYDARLRFNLASTDTEGQLALMRVELAKVAEGSAEYFDILTQILGLEERLKKERESGGGLLGPVLGGGGTGSAIEEATGGFKELEEALKGVFGTLKGEGGTVELNPVFKSIADTIGNIGKFAEEATPRVQRFIDLIMGKEVEGAEGGADPFAGNFWLGGLIPFMDELILSLDQLLETDWASLWQRFKDYVDGVVADPDDPSTFGFYTWLKDTAIPMLEELATADWAALWESYLAQVTGTWDSIVSYITARIAELTTAIDEAKKLWDDLIPDLAPGGGAIPKPKGGPFHDDQSFGGNFPGIAPLMPAMAGASSSSKINSDNVALQVVQYIGANGDFGGAHAAAETGMNRIRDDLINRRLNG